MSIFNSAMMQNATISSIEAAQNTIGPFEIKSLSLEQFNLEAPTVNMVNQLIETAIGKAEEEGKPDIEGYFGIRKLRILLQMLPTSAIKSSFEDKLREGNYRLKISIFHKKVLELTLSGGDNEWIGPKDDYDPAFIQTQISNLEQQQKIKNAQAQMAQMAQAQVDAGIIERARQMVGQDLYGQKNYNLPIKKAPFKWK